MKISSKNCTYLYKSVLIACLIILITKINVGHAEIGQEENIFREAELYTVRINTIIDIPILGEDKSSSLGAGFIINKEKGWIATNAHVAGRSPSSIKITFKDGTKTPGEKIYIDPLLDFALLKVDKNDIPDNAINASLGCDQKAKPGHPVGAYGHPWYLYFTASKGIVSGESYLSGYKYLQTDASINSGNSGGALISLSTGDVIGINTASINSNETEGLNFATPINRICKIIDLYTNGENPLPPNLPMTFYDSKESEVVKVAEVFDQSLTEILPGDIIVGINGKELNLTSPNQLLGELRGERERVKLRIKRKNELIDINYNIILMEDPLSLNTLYVDGLILTKTRFVDNKYVGLINHWLVNNVESGTTAESEEFESWDFISLIDGAEFDNIQNLYSYLNNKSDENVIFTVKRFSSSDDSRKFYDYYEYKLPINNIKIKLNN